MKRESPAARTPTSTACRQRPPHSRQRRDRSQPAARPADACRPDAPSANRSPSPSRSSCAGRQEPPEPGRAARRRSARKSCWRALEPPPPNLLPRGGGARLAPAGLRVLACASADTPRMVEPSAPSRSGGAGPPIERPMQCTDSAQSSRMRDGDGRARRAPCSFRHGSRRKRTPGAWRGRRGNAPALARRPRQRTGQKPARQFRATATSGWPT